MLSSEQYVGGTESTLLYIVKEKRTVKGLKTEPCGTLKHVQ